ncbi:MAG: extracellular solute-binding protein [candidate division KSB1 bacterium]|nr:extracellular solute-binding protein [candidate division KSB1 bacterium]MDZ7317830.1 extracellular solute-binding protein [candidate division KSB1 bacterium]MDZ7341915.1 extracellular solute-binding protein [candidate division KSB1 bacterium]
MKTLLSKLLAGAFALCIGLLLSCQQERERTIMIWHSMRPLGTKILQQKLEQFAQRHPGWRFSQLFYEPETARTNYIISAMGGSGPALLWGASDNIGPLVELGVIMPLEELLDADFLDSFITEPIAANTWFRGHLYQIADQVGNHLCLVYNKALIAQPPRTMRELREIGKKLTRDLNGDGKPDRYALAWNYTEPFFAVPFIHGFGGRVLDDHNQPQLNTAATVQAAQLIYELAHQDRIIPLECDYEVANALFIDGYSAMIINGPWSWGTYLENGIPIGISRIPMIDATGRWPSPMVSPLGYSVNINLKNEKLQVTLELVKFLTSPAVELEFTRAMGTIPSRKEAFADSLITHNEIIKSSIDQMAVGTLMPVVAELRWVWDAMRPAYQSIFTGRLTPEQAAADMQLLAEKLIRENR